ncbi:hypothetical protein [Prochlorococcus sp. MIT 1341]|uniref:hypothetical protein n=1 Tax=Prochlorococcus sp. MIT 1341 TaxID=3096221 RepID=UPI002A76381C|nr:hypothetical protein [Prochlorococcus sp. MIT 1341]
MSLRKNIFLICGGVLGGIILTESFSLLFLHLVNVSPEVNAINTKSHKGFRYHSHKQFRLSQPLPYLGSNYFDWFIKEEWSDQHPECFSGISHRGQGISLTMGNTPNCRGKTILNGWRITTNAPKEFNKRIFIYGGSTAQNSEVPNNLTIASYLQRIVNNTVREKIKVENRGFTTVVTSQQNNFLKQENIGENDIVVYYDGGNNIWQGVANGNPKGTIIGSNTSQRRLVTFKKNLSNLNTYKFLKLIKPKKNKQCLIYNEPDARQLNERANRSFDQLKEDLIYARNFTTDKKAYFIHLLQPHLFSVTLAELTNYEKKLSQTTPSEMIPCFTQLYMRTGDSVFRKRHQELKSLNITSYDIGGVFANRELNPNLEKVEANKEIYLDFMHVNEVGNKIIAHEIFRILKINKLIN